MIDIHCHLLPGIDDGPDTIDESIRLAQQAVDNGITHAVVTPHIHYGRWDNDRKKIETALCKLRELLIEEGVPLFLGMAAEVRIGPEILPMIEQHRIPYLGDWDGRHVLLLEMPHSHIPVGADKIVEWLLINGILPMVAHPERNKDVMRDIRKLLPFVELGCLFQVTAGALAGQFGPAAQRRGLQLLEQGVVTVLASDAHHIQRRPVNLLTGRQEAAKVLGEKLAGQLVWDNPLKITRQQFAERGWI